jgi:SCY1-like protein 2
MDEIIPFLAQIQSREPAVLMGITGIVKLCMENKKLEMSKETLGEYIKRDS